MIVAKRFIIPFIISLVVYAVLDFGFKSMMLYVTGGLVGGSISEVFKSVGIKVGVIPINLIWVGLLIGAVALFYRINNKAIKYATLIVIAVLVYVVDMIVSTIPYSFFDSIDKDVTLISNITIGFLVVSKSLIVSFIIHSERKRKLQEV